jgi:hypothetical protein
MGSCGSRGAGRCRYRAASVRSEPGRSRSPRTNCELRPARRAVTVLCDICGVGMMSGAARLTRGAGTGGRPTSVTTAGWARGWLTRPRPLIWKPERTTALAGAVASGQTVGRSLTTAAQAKPGRRKSGALTRRPVSPGWASPLLPLAGRPGHGLTGPPPAPQQPGRAVLSGSLRIFGAGSPHRRPAESLPAGRLSCRRFVYCCSGGSFPSGTIG